MTQWHECQQGVATTAGADFTGQPGRETEIMPLFIAAPGTQWGG